MSTNEEPTVIREFNLEEWDGVRQRHERDLAPFLEEFSEYAIGTQKPGRLALSVEASSGTVALRLAAAGRQVACTEEAPAYVAHVRARLDAAGMRGVNVFHAPVTALPIDDRMFDEVVWVMSLLPSVQTARGLREFGRVLTPGGVATIILWSGLAPTRGPEITYDRASPGARQVATAALENGFGTVEIEWCRCRCVAPNRRSLARLAAWGRESSPDLEDPPGGVAADSCAWIVRARK